MCMCMHAHRMCMCMHAHSRQLITAISAADGISTLPLCCALPLRVLCEVLCELSLL